VGPHQQWVVRVAKHRHIGHRERADGLAVVTMAQADEFAPVALPAVLPAVEAHLQGDLDRRGAVAREEGVPQRLAGAPRQPLGQLDRRRVGAASQHHMLQRVELMLQGRVDALVGMPEQVDPPRARRIEIPLAVDILEPRALSARDRNRRHGVHPLHLRARMPDARHAATLPVGVG